jgi:hypothetical protein
VRISLLAEGDSFGGPDLDIVSLLLPQLRSERSLLRGFG